MAVTAKHACRPVEPAAVDNVTTPSGPRDRLMPRLAIIAVLTLIVAACSSTKLGYRNADWLLEHYAWKTVHASTTQRDHWQPLLQATLRQHREQELPLVIAWLDLAGRISGDPHASAGAACLVDGALLLYRHHARLAVDLAVPLLAELNAEQVKHLAAHTAQRRQHAVKRYLDPDPERRKANRRERITERIEKWTGTLNKSQRQQIGDALERIPDMSTSWLVYRQQHTDTLLAMLESGANAAALRAYLDDWWVHRDGTTAETRRLWGVARHEFVQLLDSLATTLTDRQRTTLKQRLGDVRRDLASFVSGKPRPADLQLVPACAGVPV